VGQFQFGRHVGQQLAVLMRPTTETPQSFQLAINAGWFQAASFAQILAEVDQVRRCEGLYAARGEPVEEGPDITAVGANRVWQNSSMQGYSTPESSAQPCISRKVIPHVNTPVYSV
jgi:hypothetical protein